MALQIRDLVEPDLSTFVRLLNEARQGSYEFMPLTEEEVNERIKDGRSKVLVAEEDREIVGSITYNDGYWGEELRWLAVRVRPNQKLVEDALVAEAERLVHKGTVFTSIEFGSPKANEWIERGYAPSGGLYQMIAKLTAVRPLPQLPEDISVRSMKPGEQKEVIATVNSVFGWDRLKPDFVDKGKVDSPPFDEEWVHVAWHGNRVVSVVIAWPAVKFNAYFGAKRGYLGPAATFPEYRGKKIASALTVRAMNFLFEKGMDTVVLHTSELNLPSLTLVRQIGFEIGYHVKFLKKKMPQTGRVDRNLIDETSEN